MVIFIEIFFFVILEILGVFWSKFIYILGMSLSINSSLKYSLDFKFLSVTYEYSLIYRYLFLFILIKIHYLILIQYIIILIH